LGKKVIIIGSGFAGLSAAAFMAKAGWEVTVLEKQDQPGGRARILQEQGFGFDMGPSWYWMPDVFDRFFAQFGKTTSEYYSLKRLDPSYRVYWNDGPMDIPASPEKLKELFESLETGAAHKLDLFLAEAAHKYKTGMQRLVFKPGQSYTEFMDWDLIKGLFRLDIFTSMKAHVRKYFTHPRLIQLLEFPVLFLGALPEQTPALYSLMNYADMVGGTWYPQNGMYSIVNAMYSLALELGVQFHFAEDVKGIIIEKGIAKKVITLQKEWQCDAVIGAADYHFIETQLLPANARSYTDAYWEKRVMAPSCLLYYVGLNKKLEGVLHHSLFFDVSFQQHADEIYRTHQWPADPMFYMSAASVTDPSIAPEGCENLFLLIPVATGLSGDTESLKEEYFNKIITRLEKQTGQSIKDAIIYKKSIAQTDFKRMYNAFKGNAYGLANTLRQTAILKPSCRSKKIANLFYAGQLTVPGPGVPPSLISGELAAGELIKQLV
jgi:phytoene desaturase